MEKFIYWRPDSPKNDKNETFANVHILHGYNQRTIKDYQSMAEEMRKTFPQATDDNVSCSKVLESSRYDGFTILTWDGHIPAGEYPGWTQVPEGDMEYAW